MEQNQKQLSAYKMPLVNMKEGTSLTEYYVVWYSNKGFPKGVGQQLQLIYELKLNGLEELIRNIKKIPKTTIN
jgi:uncharacterized protein (DUF3820 family)